MHTRAVTVTPPWPRSRQEAVLPTQWSQKVGHMDSNQSSRYKISGRMKWKSYLPPAGSAELSLHHPDSSSPRSTWAGKMTGKSFELELTGRGRGRVVRTVAFSASKVPKGIVVPCARVLVLSLILATSIVPERKALFHWRKRITESVYSWCRTFSCHIRQHCRYRKRELFN